MHHPSHELRHETWAYCTVHGNGYNVHVAMTIESFDTRNQLVIVAAVDQYLKMKSEM
jgi:hypothetical protein